MEKRKGMVHVYTGDGKGKTTAALGLTLRAVGAGFNVFIAQFVKGMEYSELKALRMLSSQVTVEQYGRDCFIDKEPAQEDIDCARRGLKAVESVLQDPQYHLVILDEAAIAVYFNLFSIEELLSLLRKRLPSIEVVVTGRRADQQLLDYADLVSEVREVKHYYREGVEARLGIEM